MSQRVYCAIVWSLIIATISCGPLFAQAGEEVVVYLGAAADRAKFEVVAADSRDGSAAGQPLGGGRIVPATLPNGTSVLHWRVPMETYLIGVVAAEMGPDAPEAALEAQAIASRTFAMYAMKSPRRSDVGAMLDLTHRTQAYDWKRGATSAAIRNAVTATRGQYLGDEREVALFTPFHACCGGHSSLASVAWAGSDDPRHLRAEWRTERPSSTRERLGGDDLSNEWVARTWQKTDGDDGWCAPGHDGIPRWAAESYRWRRELSAREANAALVPAWRVASRGPGGHIREMRVGARSITGDLAIRGLMSPPLPSTNFSWSEGSDGAVTIHGAGRGHGVGMCQLCARGMAAQGFDATSILAEFYGEPAHVVVR